MFMQKITSKANALFCGRYKIVTAVVAMMLVFCLLTSFVVMQMNYVTVVEDGKEIASFSALTDDKDELLKAAGVTVSADDSVAVSKSENNVTIDIARAFEVTVKTADEQISLKAVAGDTVEDVLKRAKVECDESTKLSASLTDTVSADMVITVIRSTTKIIKETEIIPFETETKKSDSLYVGTTSVSQEGKNGEITKTYEVIYEDGKETGRKLIDKEVTKEAQTKIVLKGTKVKAPSSFGSKMSKEELAGAKCISVVATAYCNTSDGGQITATGTKTGFGIVAVDPRVIPLGTKLYITSADGSYVYGYCVAGDTGGAIKGNRVDLFLGSESECRAFGRRPMQVYILG